MRCVLTAVLVFAAVFESAHAQALRFDLPVDTALSDARLRIVLTGARPSSLITIGLLGPDGSQSRAAFIVDRAGEVDLSTATPVAGSYATADAMGLFWSLQLPAAEESSRTSSAPTAATPWVLSAYYGSNVVATDTIYRRVVAEHVQVTRIRQPGLSGDYYTPPGQGPHPAVIVLSGSQGGIVQAEEWPGGLASRGYAVLSLAYFNEPGTPAQLANIPLEYFEHAVNWLRARSDVRRDRIGILGNSRGGEAALLVASTYPHLIRATVAVVPSSVMWNGCCDRRSGMLPSWTHEGKPLPHMPAPADLFAARDTFARGGRVRLMPFFLHRLGDTAAVRRAAIPVERMGGPVLLISGRDDRLWPSALMSDQVIARLQAHKFPHEHRHLALENAGHVISRPYVSVVTQRGPADEGGLGGTVEGRARGHEQAWAAIAAFFDRHLMK